MSEKSFKKHYKQDKLQGNLIQKVIQDDNNRSEMSFSLRLSSQLMYGVTKLQSYQASYFKKKVLKTQEIVDVSQKGDITTKSVPESFPFQLSLRKDNLQLDKNVHLLPDNDANHGLQMMINGKYSTPRYKFWRFEELIRRRVTIT